MWERVQRIERGVRWDEVKQWPRISSCRRPAAVRIGKSPAFTNTDAVIHAVHARVCMYVRMRVRREAIPGETRRRVGATHTRVYRKSLLCSKPAKNPKSMG